MPSLAEDLLVPIDEVHGGKTVTSIRYSAWCAIIPLVYWELDLHPIHAVPRENTILPSYTQSERIKLRLSLQDHGDPIVIINRSDNLIKCVFSPLRRKSVAYGECQWGKPFRVIICQTQSLPLIEPSYRGHVKWKRLSALNKFWYCDGMRSVQHHKVLRAEPNLPPSKNPQNIV